MALLAVLKIVATATCYGIGQCRRHLRPQPFYRRDDGRSGRLSRASLFPGVTAGPGAYALVGMGTAFAGIVRTPLTSVIMIFEMTRDYSIIVPLMISNLISFLISYGLQHEPIYEALALQEGVYLPAGESRDQLARLQAGNSCSRKTAHFRRISIRRWPLTSQGSPRQCLAGGAGRPAARDDESEKMGAPTP